MNQAGDEYEDLTILGAEIARLPTPVSFELFRIRLGPLFRRVLESDAIRRRLTTLLGDLAENPQTLAPVGIDRQAGVRLFGKLPALSVACVDAVANDSPTLTGSAHHRLIGCLTGSIVLRRFSHTTVEDVAVLNRSASLARKPDIRLGSGEYVALAAWCDLADYEGDGLLLQLESVECHTNKWAYSRQTLQPIALIAANGQLGRIEDALLMLQHIGLTEDAEVCRLLAGHQAHAVRWQAIRTAFALDFPEWRALAAERATHDPHPDVKAAARAALSEPA